MIDIGTDELYELASIAKSDPYGHPYEQALDNFDNFRCLMTPSLIMWLIDSLREAERDAARYRWLRDNCTTTQADCLGPIFVMTVRRKEHLFNVGLSIDRAMKGKGDE